jgi:hypothetical protein
VVDVNVAKRRQDGIALGVRDLTHGTIYVDDHPAGDSEVHDETGDDLQRQEAASS